MDWHRAVRHIADRWRVGDIRRHPQPVQIFLRTADRCCISWDGQKQYEHLDFQAGRDCEHAVMVGVLGVLKMVHLPWNRLRLKSSKEWQLLLLRPFANFAPLVLNTADRTRLFSIKVSSKESNKSLLPASVIAHPKRSLSASFSSNQETWKVFGCSRTTLCTSYPPH